MSYYLGNYYITCRECCNILAHGDDYAQNRCRHCARKWRRSCGYSRSERANKSKQKPATWGRRKPK